MVAKLPIISVKSLSLQQLLKKFMKSDICDRYQQEQLALRIPLSEG